LGQYIDVSIQAACIDSLMDTLEMWLFAGIDYGRHSYSNVTSNKGVAQKFALRCKDGHVTFYTLGGGLLASAEHLGRVRNWMSQECSLPEWFTKIDFVREYDSAAIDQELVDKVEGTIEGFLLTKTKDEIFSKSLSDGLISAPVQDSTEVWENEQLKARNFWRSIEHKELNARIPYAGPFAILSETPVQIKRPAPLIGEHNEEVYLSELGMTKERYILLREIGAM
jgi:crotonobetainyl-CoA:carnitine CoA-transferase CaiB-like acyl-CoA transferase